MKFCIRDDDTNYYTDLEVLQSAFGDFWDEVPVTLACIPMVSPDTDAIAEPTESSPKSIEENKQLVSYLSQRLREGSIEIALHGYHHDAPDENPEFVSGKELSEKVEKGRELLESTFDTDVRLFVPPHVRLSNRGVRAIRSESLDIVRGYGPRPREAQPHPRWWVSYARFLTFHARCGREFRYPYPINYGTHWEVYSHRLNRRTDLDSCKRAFNYIKDKDAVFCLSVHANGLNNLGREKLREMVSYAKDSDPDFVTVSGALDDFTT
jgi:peptidoglycan/xylan/chitin deacetylase (PgdA/CDA1 family)